ncbi:hypothetical protein Bca4012_026369 [Brassica carinata]
MRVMQYDSFRHVCLFSMYPPLGSITNHNKRMPHDSRQPPVMTHDCEDEVRWLTVVDDGDWSYRRVLSRILRYTYVKKTSDTGGKQER